MEKFFDRSMGQNLVEKTPEHMKHFLRDNWRVGTILKVHQEYKSPIYLPGEHKKSIIHNAGEHNTYNDVWLQATIEKVYYDEVRDEVRNADEVLRTREYLEAHGGIEKMAYRQTDVKEIEHDHPQISNYIEDYDHKLKIAGSCEAKDGLFKRGRK